jgi:hypothetical protein
MAVRGGLGRRFGGRLGSFDTGRRVDFSTDKPGKVSAVGPHRDIADFFILCFKRSGHCNFIV